MRHPIQPSPSDLFDAAFHRRHDDQFDALGLEVVARPGDPVPLNADDDLLVVRRALGENRLAIIAEVHRIVEGRGSLEAQGIECEGYGEGIFAEVADSRSRRKGRRIAGVDGLVVRDSLLVRRRRTPPDQPVAEPAVPFDFDRPDLPNPPDPPNPPDLIDDVHDLPPLEHSTEAITDPITPPRRPLAISATVGRGGRNNAPDVKAVQDRLLELRALEPNDATTERPASAAPVAETALTQTIEAIERFQRQLGIPVDGTVDVSSPTRLELDQAIGLPTAAELAAIATARNTIAQSISRGLTIKGPVGATTTGNMPDDVRAVQRRLVEIGKLSSSHIEAPPAAATAAVTQANLPATIRSLRAMQSDVEFWTAKGTITGSSTAGLVSPGDATAALLDRISVYSMTLGPHRVSFRDHIVSGNTRSDAGVMFVGTASPSTLPLADYRAVGLSPAQAAALKLVSAHEGSFDAINTYDRALVSAGFIQFAGSRGLPRYLALLKARHEATFRDLLHKFGIDVEFSVKGRAIDTARVVVLDPDGNRVLRATAAEAAIRDDKRLTTALIVSGRDRDVQLTQLEAAVRDYVLPILNATVSWGAGAARAALKDLCRSQKGMAALFDRCIQEGLGAARRRFERVIQRLVAAAPPAPTKRATPPPLTDLQRREGDILAEVERDLQAAADVANRLARARTLLSRLIRDTRTAGATPAGIVARPELTDVRQAVREARVAVPGIVNLTTPSGVTVEAALEAMKNSLAAEETRLAMTPMPESLDAVRAALVASRQALANVLGPVATAPMFLARIQRIRRSTLDASLGPAEVELTA
jgi:peptidoglycan hydrolase-like protein with peptidoglycan-binding domain